MHIGFVTTESPYGERGACGIAAYIRAIVPSLLEHGHRVSVFGNAKEEADFHAEDGRVPVYHFRLPSTHWYAAKVPGVRRLIPLPLRQLEWSAAFYRKVARIVSRTRIDVIESTETGSLFLSRIAPVVMRLHGSEFSFRNHSRKTLDKSVRWNDSLEAYSCKRATAITTPSQFLADEITKRRGWPVDRIRVIPNPISGNLLKAALKFERNGNAERIVLYTGRLAPVKGIETLLEAAQLVHGRDPSVTFVLAGPWQMPNSPEVYGLQLNRKSDFGVQWIGSQTQDELISWYKRAALFVMPSYFESFGISALEAIAFGLPVVATDTSGLAEVLGRNGSGSLVAKGNAKAFAEEVISSLSSLRERREKAEQMRAVAQKFSPEHIAAKTLKVYEAVQAEARL